MPETLALLGDTGLRMAGWIAAMNLWTALAFGVAWLADRALARRVRARSRLLLYSIVLLRLLLPAGWSSGIGVLALDRTPLVFLLGAGSAHGLVADTPSIPVRSPRLAPWSAPVVPAYALGVLALAGTVLGRQRRLARELERAVPARGTLAALAPGATVLEHPTLGPAVIGLRSPRMVIPARLAGALSAPQARFVLRHEQAHITHRDGWLVALALVVAVAAWPVLPVWLALRRVRELVEIACDEAALDGEPLPARREYGETLLHVAASRTEPAPGGIMAALGGDLEARIRALRHTRSWPRGVQVALSAVAAAVGLAVAVPSSAPALLLTATPAAASDEPIAPAQIDLEIRVYGVDDYGLAVSLVSICEACPVPVCRGTSSGPISRELATELDRSLGPALAMPRVRTLEGTPAEVRGNSSEGELAVLVNPRVIDEGFALDVELSSGSLDPKVSMHMEVRKGQGLLILRSMACEPQPRYRLITIFPALRGTASSAGPGASREGGEDASRKSEGGERGEAAAP